MEAASDPVTWMTLLGGLSKSGAKGAAGAADDAADLLEDSADDAARSVGSYTDDAVGAGKLLRHKMTRTYELEPTHEKILSNSKFNILKADIKMNGIKDPVKYVEYNGQKYVVDGHHRLLAARQLGIKEIPTEEVSLPYKGYRTWNDLIW